MKDGFRGSGAEDVEKPSKEEYTVAKWIRKNVPIKKTKLFNHNVEYFTGKRAVDALLNSPFATSGEKALFVTREEIVDYLHTMLVHKFFHRAKKVPVKDYELRPKKKDGKKEKKEQEKSDKGTDAESSVVEGNKTDEKEKEKKKKKIRLEMHGDQRFVDGLDAYVWIYDPVPLHYWIMGTLLVLGTIAMCLFPLWPASVRTGVYYLSLGGIGFFVGIIIMVIVRGIIFCLVWLCTWGKHHLWILPNLTEEVGFFESFWPLYHYEYRGEGYVPKSKKDKKKKKEKDSDAEEDTKQDDKKDTETRNSEETDGKSNDAPGANAQPSNDQSESESESSQRSSTGKDFEMVDEDDVL